MLSRDPCRIFLKPIAVASYPDLYGFEPQTTVGVQLPFLTRIFEVSNGRRKAAQYPSFLSVVLYNHFYLYYRFLSRPNAEPFLLRQVLVSPVPLPGTPGVHDSLGRRGSRSHAYGLFEETKWGTTLLVLYVTGYSHPTPPSDWGGLRLILSSTHPTSKVLGQCGAGTNPTGL